MSERITTSNIENKEAEPGKILIRKAGDRFEAQVSGEGSSYYGDSAAEAIGSLVASNLERFGLELEWDKEEKTS